MRSQCDTNAENAKQTKYLKICHQRQERRDLQDRRIAERRTRFLLTIIRMWRSEHLRDEIRAPLEGGKTETKKQRKQEN